MYRPYRAAEVARVCKTSRRAYWALTMQYFLRVRWTHRFMTVLGLHWGAAVV